MSYIGVLFETYRWPAEVAACDEMPEVTVRPIFKEMVKKSLVIINLIPLPGEYNV